MKLVTRKNVKFTVLIRKFKIKKIFANQDHNFSFFRKNKIVQNY